MKLYVLTGVIPFFLVSSFIETDAALLILSAITITILSSIKLVKLAKQKPYTNTYWIKMLYNYMKARKYYMWEYRRIVCAHGLWLILRNGPLSQDFEWEEPGI